MILGASFLIFGVIGLALVRRKVSIIKRKNPEVTEALKAQSKKRREDEKTVGIRDLPPWIIVLLLVVVVVGYMGELGTFRFDPLVDTLLGVLMVFSLIYYFLYKRRVRNKKYGENSDSLNPSTQH
jgi:Flp pilus assembly protein TadB